MLWLKWHNVYIYKKKIYKWQTEECEYLCLNERTVDKILCIANLKNILNKNFTYLKKR